MKHLPVLLQPVVFALLSLSTLPGIAQPSNDELFTRLKETTEDSIRIATLLDLAYNHARTDIDKAIQFVDQAMALTQTSGLKRYLPFVSYNYALLFRNKGSFDTSLFHINQFIAHPVVQKDSMEMIKGLHTLTSIYYEQEDLEKTLQTAHNLLSVSKNTNTTSGQISALSFMALTMSDRNKIEDAIKTYKEAIELCISSGDSTRLANMYNNLAGTYLKAHDYDKAIEYYERTKEMDERDQYTWGLFNVHHNIGNVHIWREDYQKAQEHLQTAYQMQEKIGSTQELIMTAYKLGYVIAKNGNREKGISMLEKSLEDARTHNYRQYEEESLRYLSILSEDGKDPAKALAYYKDYKAISDTIWKTQLEAKTDELEVKYATAEQKANILALHNENQIKDLQLAKAARMRWGLLLSLFGIGLIAILIYRNLILKKKANYDLEQKNKIIEENLKEKSILLREIHHRVKNNLQIISSLLSLQSRSVDDESIKGAMKISQNRVRSMALIHQNLYQEQDLIGVDTKDYISSLTSSLWHSYNIEEERISLKTDIQQLKLDVDIMIPMGLILNELISNALKYAFVDGRSGSVAVSLHSLKDKLQLIVKDDGVGLPSPPRQEPSKTMGMKLIKAFTQKLKAKMEIKNDHGTEIIVDIPRAAAA